MNHVRISDRLPAALDCLVDHRLVVDESCSSSQCNRGRTVVEARGGVARADVVVDGLLAEPRIGRRFAPDRTGEGRVGGRRECDRGADRLGRFSAGFVVRGHRPLYAAIGATLKESLKTYNLLDERNWYITPADED